MIKKFIEVPNTNIKEPVLNNQWADELCLQIADDYGYAEIVWYALNGKRVVEGNYGDPSLVGIERGCKTIVTKIWSDLIKSLN